MHQSWVEKGSFHMSTFLGYILGQNLLYLNATFLSPYTQHHPDHNTMLQAFLFWINACGKKNMKRFPRCLQTAGCQWSQVWTWFLMGAAGTRTWKEITRGQHVRHNSTLLPRVKCGFGDVMGKGREKLLWEALSEILYVHTHVAVTGGIAQQKGINFLDFLWLICLLTLALWW